MTLDIDFIRAQFPAFQDPALQAQAFFENAGGSYTCQQTIDRLTRFYTQRKVQPYGPYGASIAGGAEMDEARSKMARILGVSPKEVSFGPSTTQNVYVLAQAFAEYLSPGDTVIVTNQDHEANSGAWRKLERHGITLREWRINPDTGCLDVQDLQNMLDDTCRLVCFPHCSNVVGHINPVADICRMAKAAGAAACVDGVSYAPHGLPNVGALGADIYMFSAYKTYGPHQGIMTIRADLAMALPNQAHWFNADTPYKRLTPAGPDHAQVAACAGMADYYDAVYAHHFGASDAADHGDKAAAVNQLFVDHETALNQQVLDFLKDRNDLRLIGPADAQTRAPTIAVDTAKHPWEVATALAGQGINCGASSFYANRPLNALGVDPERGVLRLSFVHYTTQDDIDRLLNGLDQTL